MGIVVPYPAERRQESGRAPGDGCLVIIFPGVRIERKAPPRRRKTAVRSADRRPRPPPKTA